MLNPNKLNLDLINHHKSNWDLPWIWLISICGATGTSTSREPWTSRRQGRWFQWHCLSTVELGIAWPPPPPLAWRQPPFALPPPPPFAWQPRPLPPASWPDILLRRRGRWRFGRRGFCDLQGWERRRGKIWRAIWTGQERISRAITSGSAQSWEGAGGLARRIAAADPAMKRRSSQCGFHPVSPN